MNTIPLVDSERTTQNRVINLLHNYCGYQYLGYKQDADNLPIIPEILGKFIKDTQHASNTEIDKVLRLLDLEISRCHDKDTLFQSNLNFYSYLRYGVNIQGDDGQSKTVKIIEWPEDNVANNIFSLAVGSKEIPSSIICVTSIPGATDVRRMISLSLLEG